MADFPENEVEIFEEYVSDEFLRGLVGGFSRDSLTSLESFDTIEPTSKRDQLSRIARARKGLLRFFNDPGVKERQERLRAVAGAMSKGSFAEAQTNLDALVNAAPLHFSFDFTNAFNTLPVSFNIVDLVDNLTPGKPPVKQVTPATIPAYEGPKPGDAPGRRLLVLNEFVAKGAEHRFRTGLLQAEIDPGRGACAEAIERYERLLAATTPGSARHKFIALRAALAQLAFADQLFRKQRAFNDQERQSISDRYAGAVRVLQENGVAPDNPLRRQVEAHAHQQQTK